jgi:subtilase family serine protease
MAPNAEIHVVQAASDSIQDLRQALIFANQTVKADIISQSWGIDESVVAQYNLQYLLEDQYLPGRQASGNPGSFYLAAAGDNSTLSYPASSPNNIAVGGTALDMNGLQRTGEQVWYDPGSSDGSSSSSSIGSGKGISTIFPRPAYQATVNDSPFRMTPDLSCVADTSNGQGVVIIHNGQAYGVAGTSVSCPTLAGMLATALSARRSPITQGLLMTKLYGGVVISSPLTPLQGLGRVNKRFIDSVVAM